MGLRILVADGSRSMCAFLEFALRAVGDVHVERALDRRAALDCLASGRFDAVLLDPRLPGSSGADVLVGIRALPRDRRPQVVLIANDAEEARAGASRGIEHVLIKPLLAEAVHNVLSQALEIPAPPPAPGVERRQARRLPLPLTVHVRTAGGPTLVTNDVSPFGAFLPTTETPAVGDRLELAIEFPHLDEPIEVEATVRHVRPDGFGVKFDHGSLEVAKRLLDAFRSPDGEEDVR